MRQVTNDDWLCVDCANRLIAFNWPSEFITTCVVCGKSANARRIADFKLTEQGIRMVQAGVQE